MLAIRILGLNDVGDFDQPAKSLRTFVLRRIDIAERIADQIPSVLDAVAQDYAVLQGIVDVRPHEDSSVALEMPVAKDSRVPKARWVSNRQGGLFDLPEDGALAGADRRRQVEDALHGVGLIRKQVFRRRRDSVGARLDRVVERPITFGQVSLLYPLSCHELGQREENIVDAVIAFMSLGLIIHQSNREVADMRIWMQCRPGRRLSVDDVGLTQERGRPFRTRSALQRRLADVVWLKLIPGLPRFFACLGKRLAKQPVAKGSRDGCGNRESD